MQFGSLSSRTRALNSTESLWFGMYGYIVRRFVRRVLPPHSRASILTIHPNAITGPVPAHHSSLCPSATQPWTTTETSVENVVSLCTFVSLGLAAKSLDNFIFWYMLCTMQKCCVLMDISVFARINTIVVTNGGVSLKGCPPITLSMIFFANSLRGHLQHSHLATTHFPQSCTTEFSPSLMGIQGPICLEIIRQVGISML